MTDTEFREFVQYHVNLTNLVEHYKGKLDNGFLQPSKNKKVLEYYKLKLYEAEQIIEELKK